MVKFLAQLLVVRLLKAAVGQAPAAPPKTHMVESRHRLRQEVGRAESEANPKVLLK